MKISHRARLSGLVTALAAVTVLAGTAAPAQAINRVDCAGRTDFFSVVNDGQLCFANAGYTDVAIYGVRQVNSGNNSGEFSMARTTSSPVQNVAFSKYNTIAPDWGQAPFHKVSSIKIF
ncbi:beta/gamma crystallin domain-containing protein [Streptomyces sp. NPDC059255]|uniref:beta/gamma crystallin domain-containing protein n=1 Tax=Streptomyces sp. NPDC059255 TaxID=3346793 RepID=UPI003688E851